MNNELHVDESELKALSQYLPAKGQGHHENLRITLAQDLNTGSSKYEATLGLVRVKRA